MSHVRYVLLAIISIQKLKVKLFLNKIIICIKCYLLKERLYGTYIITLCKIFLTFFIFKYVAKIIIYIYNKKLFYTHNTHAFLTFVIDGKSSKQ